VLCWASAPGRCVGSSQCSDRLHAYNKTHTLWPVKSMPISFCRSQGRCGVKKNWGQEFADCRECPTDDIMGAQKNSILHPNSYKKGDFQPKHCIFEIEFSDKLKLKKGEKLPLLLSCHDVTGHYCINIDLFSKVSH